MKFWSRAVRILLATVVATQGAAFIPAMAASQSKRLAVKAIGIEELKSEFGAGGGGGGGDPDPGCGSSGGARPQSICKTYDPPPPPIEIVRPSPCNYDLDQDGACDWFDMGRATPFASASTPYPSLVDTSDWAACSQQETCRDLSVSVSGSRTFSIGVDASGGGDVGKIALALGVTGQWSWTTEFSQTHSEPVNRGFRFRIEAWKIRYQVSGFHEVPLSDYNTYTTGTTSWVNPWSGWRDERGVTWVTVVGACPTPNCQFR